MNVEPLKTAKRRGRPPKAHLDPSTVELLTIPEALAFTQAKGRGISRLRLMDAILAKQIRAMEDDLHHDRFGNPLLMVVRMDLEAWLTASLRPFDPAAASSASKGA